MQNLLVDLVVVLLVHKFDGSGLLRTYGGNGENGCLDLQVVELGWWRWRGVGGTPSILVQILSGQEKMD